MNVEIKTFDQLDVHKLYKILDLRNRVFVVEQNCIYTDTDERDYKSHHFYVVGQ